MAYNPDVKAESPPNYPQQTAQPLNQAVNNDAGAQNPGAYANPQVTQYAQHPQQLGNPYAQATGQQQQPFMQPLGQGPPHVLVTHQPMVMAQPQMMVGCPQGHVYVTHYGACGIITAILCFPLGLIALFIDSERVCTRCGARDA